MDRKLANRQLARRHTDPAALCYLLFQVKLPPGEKTAFDFK